MKKEIIFAIIAGAIFGVAVAVGLWRAKSVITNEEPATDEQESEQAQGVQSQLLELTITSHTSGSVISTSPITIQGITGPTAWVAVNSNQDTAVQASNDGVFNVELELEPGINEMLFSAYNNEGNLKEEETVVLVYSEDFEDIE